MKTLWISISVALIIASVDAQRNFNLSKPIINLGKRPRPMTWLRPPEERRKLSIFPKNNVKFVVTPKTAVKSEETATTDLTTKRPLMRKFIVHDKNEKGSWYFAPREPLMKTKRFTVTIAPQRRTEINDDFRHSLKPNDEMADESKKVKTVINNAKTQKDLNNAYTNKGNLIDVLRNKKNNVATSKHFVIVDKVAERNAVNKQTNITTKNNSLHNLLHRDVYENRTENTSNALNELQIIDKSEDDNTPIIINKSLPPLNIEEILSETIEGRSVDLNDMTLIDRNENNVLRLNKETLNGNIDNSANIKAFETLIENILNGSAISNNDPPSLNSYNDRSIKITNDATNKIVDNIPQELLVETNNVYQVKLINESILNTTEKSAEILKAETLVSDEKEHFSSETQNVDKYIVEDYTSEPVLSTTELEIRTHNHVKFISDIHYEPQNDLPGELLFGNLGTESIIFQTTSHNVKSEDGLPAESVSGLESKFLDESLNNQSNITNEVHNDVLIDEILPVTEVTNELLINMSDNETSEDVSNESLIDKSNISMSEEDSKESSLTGKELSNESINDQSNNLTEEISNESLLDKSINYTDEVSNESNVGKINNLTDEDEELSNESNMAGEEISNESMINDNYTKETSNESKIDNSNNYTDELSNETTNTNNLTGEGISNESNMAGEEISNESVENYNNLTEEISNSEALIDISLTIEDISDDVVIGKSNNLTGEDISDESNLSLEKKNPNRFKRGIIEEENLPTSVSGFKYTGREVRLGHDLSFKNINA